MALRRASALRLDAASYARHPLHGDDCAWVEKNCYVDVWIEVLHALKLDPFGVLPFTVAVDFEGDQWTFYKPPHGDLLTLYGVDVQELNVWRTILHHALHHVYEGKLVFTEADAFFLPDTRGTDYRRQHTKTTIVIETIDAEARTLGYFHNGSYHTLGADDFASLFRLEGASDPAVLPLFAELVRVDRLARLPRAELAARSAALLAGHLARRPVGNPFTGYRRRFEADIEWLKGESLAVYHAYAFATIRQFGSNFELASLYLKWLGEALNLDGELTRAAVDFDTISSTAKALILKGARAVTTEKPTDFSPMMETLAESWQSGMDHLASRFARGLQKEGDRGAGP